jgi:hypothetical protein
VDQGIKEHTATTAAPSPVRALRAAAVVSVLVMVACGGEAEAMKITFKQSGGFAAVLPGKSCVLDAAALAGGDAKRLQSLVDESGLQEMESADWKFETGADLQTYEITIQSDRGLKQFSFDDMSVPKDAYPLLEFLQGKCE